jgi:hypothetical protein
MSETLLHWFDVIVVACVLLASILYALSSLGPRSVRRALLVRFRGRDAAAAVKPAGGCGGCGDCGSGQAQEAGAPAGEVSVPVSKIGKR